MSIIKRKSKHIKLVKQSQVLIKDIDERFNYEPLLSNHLAKDANYSFQGKRIGGPIFISSMTGGTYKSKIINKRLAIAAGNFNIPMGLGSIRPYLEGLNNSGFNLREYSGYDVQLYGNLGIAQVEKLVNKNQLHKLITTINDLELNGLIIHINPLQEWIQVCGDRFKVSPLETLKYALPLISCTKIIKEVGCGFGPESLKSLVQLPVDVIDLSAFGGTNFSKIEILLNKKKKRELLTPLINIGHSPQNMIDNLNDIKKTINYSNIEFIISGGIRNYLDGYYYNSLLDNNSLYGYAGKLLKHAQRSQKSLLNFIEEDINQYNFSSNFLRIKNK